jgi:Uma2 family endonuclease
MAAVDLLRHRWNRHEYDLLDPEAFRRTELIDGEILHVPAMSQRHIFTTAALHACCVQITTGRHWVSGQSPIILDDFSEPEPDVWVRHAAPTSLEDVKPFPADLLLVAEVADTSFGSDKAFKIPTYARAGVPLVWLVDVRRRTITVYSDPIDGAYTQEKTIAPNAEVALPWGGTLPIAQLFIG